MRVLNKLFWVLTSFERAFLGSHESFKRELLGSCESFKRTLLGSHVTGPSK